MKYKYKFTVIIPVYNVEAYLEETLESVINQTIGFKKNIQLILVNDGSPDNSGEICRKYKNMYPENVLYIEKENGGVSSARNAGIEHIEGKYVNFLDSDDKWEKDAFKKAYKFFEKHYDEIDILSARMKFFEAKTNYHTLDFRFDNGTRIADLRNEEEIFNVQMTAATTFIKSSAIKDLRFDTNIKFSEDSIFINRILIDKCKLGYIKEIEYLYRRRSANDSAINTQKTNPSYYLDTTTGFHHELIKLSIEKFGEVLPYIQATVAYDLLWRLDIPDIKDTLNEDEYNSFINIISETLSYIDDKILLTIPVHKNVYRIETAFNLKYGNNGFLKALEFKDGLLYYGDDEFLDLRRNSYKVCRVDFFKINNDSITVEMLVAEWLINKLNYETGVHIKVGKELYEPVFSEVFNNEKVDTFDGIIPRYVLYRFEFGFNVKKDKILKIRPVLSLNNETASLSTAYGKFIPNCNTFKPQYQVYDNYIIRYLKTVIKIENPSDFNKAVRQYEKKLTSFLKDEKNNNKADVIRKKLPSFKAKNKNFGDIWLFSDRIDNAGDNGEVMFKYVCEHKPEGVRPIFVIGGEADESIKNRLKSIGETIEFEDEEYPYYFLSAKKIISSSGADFFVFNPFENRKKYFMNLYDFKYYYLQHGVTCADLSEWLNRFNKNIYRMFASGEKERDAILEADYYYTPEQIIVTGQSRFDALYNEPKKQILILPTWRKSIEESYDEKTVSVYFDGFKETDYFKFYNSLINDERLLKVMREIGYTGLFCIHPIHKEQAIDFEGNDVFKINEGFVDYNKVFAESNLMVTDYSSVLFDFAYLRKPVVYAQFDKEEFFETQIYDEGYFKYERDGFGPVCYNLDDTVNEIIKLIQNDCNNDEKYVERVNSFFKYSDKNNSKRILEYILEDDKNA